MNLLEVQVWPLISGFQVVFCIGVQLAAKKSGLEKIFWIERMVGGRKHVWIAALGKHC